MKKDLNVTLHVSDIIANEKLVEFGNILLGRVVALGNSAPLVKKISEIKRGMYLPMNSSFILSYIFKSQSVFEIELSCFFPNLPSIGSLVQSIGVDSNWIYKLGLGDPDFYIT